MEIEIDTVPFLFNLAKNKKKKERRILGRDGTFQARTRRPHGRCWKLEWEIASKLLLSKLQ